MQPLLDNLRRIGVVPVVGSAAASSGREVVIEQFAGYLIGDCGLAASTIVNYRAVAGRFLAGCRWESGALVGVSSESVNSFVLGEATRRSGGSLNTVATGLRVLLRFLHSRHYISAPLVDAFPVAPGWRDRGVVRALAGDEVAGMLEGCGPAKQDGIGPVEVLDRVTMQVFVRRHCTMIAAPVQCDVYGIPKGSHYVILQAVNSG
jgi:hypothetical protein